MGELAAFLAALDDADRAGERTAIATVVSAEGSNYRRPGARILIRETGETTGLLSGGCLEGDVAERTRSVFAGGPPRLQRYDLRDTESGVWGLGIGCDGVVEVWIESRDAEPGRALVDGLRRVLVEGLTLRVSTVFASDDPARVAPGRRSIEIETRTPSHRIVAERAASAVDRRIDGVRVRMLEERVEPPQRLWILGAGEDAEPLVAAAEALGWRLVLIDRREARLAHPAFERCERFPSLRAAFEAHAPNASDAFVAMTHRFEDDRDAMIAWASRPAAYTGWLGPRTRTARLLDEAIDAGAPVDDAFRARMHAPVGLDVGADTPAEIALAIVAEILAVRRERRSGFLRDREAPMHPEPSAERES